MLAPLLIALFLVSEAGPVVVEPPDLARRSDLIGREVVVDGRVRLFQLHRGRGFDEILLRESDVIFRLPPRLIYRDAPSQRVAKIQGTLRKEGSQLVVDVSSVQLLPSDQERLNRGIAALEPRDQKTRLAWARWASRRAEIYQDQELASKARQLRTEAIRMEAESPEAERPSVAMGLAEQARQLGLDEPLASALAHRAFQARARDARTPEELDALAAEVARFLPASQTPKPGDAGRWQAAYENDPYAAYLQADEQARQVLDRQLLADLQERSFREQATAEPTIASELAEQAGRDLPERPRVAQDIKLLGLKTASKDVAKLRRDQVLDLSKDYATIGQPDESRQLVRSWLQDRRQKLANRRAVDERIQLAEDFMELDEDRLSALQLLREADSIDPESKLVTDAFRRLGYRRQGEDWVAAIPEQDDDKPTASDDSPSLDDPLIGMTPEEVVSRLGKPDRKSQVITQARGTIQWVYQGDGTSAQYINFEKRPGYPPQVIAHYVLR